MRWLPRTHPDPFYQRPTFERGYMSKSLKWLVRLTSMYQVSSSIIACTYWPVVSMRVVYSESLLFRTCGRPCRWVLLLDKSRLRLRLGCLAAAELGKKDVLTWWGLPLICSLCLLTASLTYLHSCWIIRRSHTELLSLVKVDNKMYQT